MNVNLWGPELWSVLHGVAGLVAFTSPTTKSPTWTKPQSRRAFLNMLDDLQVLLPCIHCRNSYQTFFQRKDAEASEPMEYVYKLHEQVNRKLALQKLEKFKLSPELLPVVLAQPTFEVVKKRFVLSNGQPFADSSVWRTLFAFVMADDASSNPEARRQAFLRFVQNLALLVHSDLSDQLSGLAQRLPKTYSSKQGFVLVAMFHTRGSYEEVAKLWEVYQLLPAKSCATTTCA